MTDEEAYTRREFVEGLSAAGLAAGVGVAGAGCDDESADSEGVAGGTTAAEGGASDRSSESDESDEPTEGSGESSSLEGRLTERLGSLKDLTRIDFGPLDRSPFETALQSAIDAEPERIGWLLAPSGKGLGIGAYGTGGTFTEATRGYVESVVGERGAGAFRRLREVAPGEGLDVETVLSTPNWVRAGVRLESFDAVRRVHETLGAPEEERERMLRFESVDRAQPTWLHLAQTVEQRWRLMGGTRLPAGADVEIVPDHVADRPVTVDILANSDRQWLRCPADGGESLLRWQRNRGVTARADSTRIRRANRLFEVDGPDWMAWEAGKVAETLVYVYDRELEW